MKVEGDGETSGEESKLTFYNYDSTGVLTVSNCVANLVVKMNDS